MDFAYFYKSLLRIAQTIPYTVMIALLSCVISIVLATLLAMLRIKKIPVIEQLSKLYLSFFVSTPGLIHIFLVYYGLPAFLKLFGINLGYGGKFAYAVAALCLNYVAQLSEVIRPAYLSIDKGQHEAAICYGLNTWQKETRIILPQVLPVALPAVANGFVELIKDTSILFVLGIQDIMGKARTIISNDYGAKKLEVYLAVGLVYLVVISVCTIGTKQIEKRCQIVKKRERAAQ